jgi:hypothetical protein
LAICGLVFVFVSVIVSVVYDDDVYIDDVGNNVNVHAQDLRYKIGFVAIDLSWF